MTSTTNQTAEGGNLSSDEDLFNPSKQPGDNVWEPDPKTIVKLYEKLDKDGILELKWKSPGRIPINEQTTPQKQVDIVYETPEEDLKLKEKQKMLSMFDADDLSNQIHTPGSLSKSAKAPKTPKSTVKVKASFDKIFNKVSLQAAGGENSPSDNSESKGS